jgi:hypothetical protein
MKEYGGNVHDCFVIEKEGHGANRNLGTYNSNPSNAAKNVADLGTGSYFLSVYCMEKDIMHKEMIGFVTISRRGGLDQRTWNSHLKL